MRAEIFKAYDIRGLSPDEIDGALARRLGQALAKAYKPAHVVVGKDMRATSNELERGLIEGLVSSGVNVTQIGLCSTPMFNFAIGEADGGYDLGVMVTASHNPAAYNGFKLTRAGCVPIGQGSGMEKLRDLVVSDVVFASSKTRGTIKKDETVLDRYLDRVFALARLPSKLPDWNIGIDAGNGMEGLILPKLVRRLTGPKLIPLFWDLDGTFPNHQANPLKTETLKALQSTIKEKSCAFGAAFDGDSDRVGFVDETGAPIPGDILTAILAQEMLRVKKSGKVLYDLRSSWSVPEAITKAGGEPVMCKVGHANIKKQMREEGAIFAGELSMHFYFADLWNCESSDLAMLLLLKIMIRKRETLSRIWRSFKRYAHSEEINFTVKDGPAILRKLGTKYRKAATEASKLDGLRMEFRNPEEPGEDWWFNVRLSNTEPLLRLNLEARTVDVMERRKAELSKLIQSLA